MGETLTVIGRYEEAEELLSRSHATLLAAIKSETNWMVVESTNRVVHLYDAWQRPDDARRVRDQLADAVAFAEYTPQWTLARGAFDPACGQFLDSADQLRKLCGGASYMATPGVRKVDGLRPVLDRVLAARTECFARDATTSILSARLLLTWANGLDAAVHVAERKMMVQAALDALRGVERISSLEIAEAATVLSDCARREGRFDDAADYARQAVEILAEPYPTGDWFIASQEARVARVLSVEGHDELAGRMLNAAYDMMRAQVGEQHPDTTYVAQLLKEHADRIGRTTGQE